jgi:hypothetical protein
MSSDLALCATATTLVHHAGGLHRYVNRPPTGSKNDCFLLPQRCQSTFISLSISLCEQNCCRQTKFGSCSVAGLLFFCLALSQNRKTRIAHYRFGEFIDQLFHVAQMTYLSVLLTVCTKLFRHSCFTLVEMPSPQLTHTLLIWQMASPLSLLVLCLASMPYF